MTGMMKVLSLNLAAADDNGICQSQSPGAAGNLTINGALASGGVATMDVARRVGITSAGDDSTATFTVTGTDRYGRAQTETVTGTNGSVASTEHDFLTVAVVHISKASAAAVIVGTTSVGSTDAWIVDSVVNPQGIGFQVESVGTADCKIETSTANLFPTFDFANNTVNWASDVEFSLTDATVSGKISVPCLMARLTVTSGTGAISARFMQSFGV